MLPTADLPERELGDDLEPFRILAPEARLVMTSHAVYPSLAQGPATLEPGVLERLRGYGFEGAIVCDDLDMDALGGDTRENARRALLAGCDAILACRNADAMRAAADALEGEGMAGRGGEAAGRLAAALPPVELGSRWDAGAWRELERDYRAFTGSG